MAPPIRVLVVDDSRMMRKMLCRVIEAEPGFEVVGAAEEPYAARDILVRARPDVVTLDLELPRMDGVTFLRKYMAVIPTPTVVVSGATGPGQKLAIEAMEAGAVDVLVKDELRPGSAFADTLIRSLRAAAGASVTRDERPVQFRPSRAPAPVRPSVMPRGGYGPAVMAIGASTGGVEAVLQVVPRLPEDAPPTLVVVHMPPGFTRAFAQRLDAVSAMTVVEASGNEPLTPGKVYVAPGGRHLVVRRVGAELRTHVHDGDRVSHHRPSVDALFTSLVEHVGAETSAALLTGMGADGADGLLALRRKGAFTVAQDEATSAVYGMPAAARRLGAAREVLPIDGVARALLMGKPSTRRDSVPAPVRHSLRPLPSIPSIAARSLPPGTLPAPRVPRIDGLGVPSVEGPGVRGPKD